MILRAIIFLLVTVTPGWAADVTFTGRMEQGGIVVGTVQPGTKVTLGKRSLPVTEDGRFLLGLNRDAPRNVVLLFEMPNGVQETETLTVAPREWKIERVDGVPQRLVTPDPETVKKIAADSRLMAAARSEIELVPFFDTGFIRPAEGRISGVYGSQRILNGSPRAPHSGLDIAAPEGNAHTCGCRRRGLARQYGDDPYRTDRVHQPRLRFAVALHSYERNSCGRRAARETG